MASGATLTTMDAALKTLYSSDKVEMLAYTNRPLLAMLDKFEDFTGRNMQIPLIVENPQGRSSTFSAAQNRSTLDSSLIKDWLITRASDYGVVTINAELIDATANDAGSFLDAVETEMDGVLNSLSNSAHSALYGNGFGSIGVASGWTSGSATVTLSNPDDIVNFAVGQELISAATDTGTPRSIASTFGGIVTSVNRAAGSLVTAPPMDTAITGFATGDTLIVRGDRDASGTALKISGLRAWLPFGGPTSTAFFNVDRTVDNTRLAGNYFDGTLVTIEEALLKASAIAFREGGAPDTCFLSPTQFNNLVTALGSKVMITDVKTGTTSIGFKGIEIQGQAGPITVVPDPKCPNQYGFMLQLDMWKLYSAGKVPHIQEYDGLSMLRQPNDDGVEIRCNYRAQLACRKPSANVVIKLA